MCVKGVTKGTADDGEDAGMKRPIGSRGVSRPWLAQEGRTYNLTKARDRMLRGPITSQNEGY